METKEKEEILVNIFNQYGNFNNVDDIFPLEDSAAQQIKLCLFEAMDTVYERGRNDSNVPSNCNKPHVSKSEALAREVALKAFAKEMQNICVMDDKLPSDEYVNIWIESL